MILCQSVVQLLILFVDFLDLFVLVVLDFSYLTFELIDFFFFVLGVLGSLLPQLQKVPFAVGFSLLQGIYFGLKLFYHLGMRVFLLSSSGKHFLHDDFIVGETFVN
jgi:hypothetical protein